MACEKWKRTKSPYDQWEYECYAHPGVDVPLILLKKYKNKSECVDENCQLDCEASCKSQLHSQGCCYLIQENDEIACKWGVHGFAGKKQNEENLGAVTCYSTGIWIKLKSNISLDAI